MVFDPAQANLEAQRQYAFQGKPQDYMNSGGGIDWGAYVAASNAWDQQNAGNRTAVTEQLTNEWEESRNPWISVGPSTPGVPGVSLRQSDYNDQLAKFKQHAPNADVSNPADAASFAAWLRNTNAPSSSDPRGSYLAQTAPGLNISNAQAVELASQYADAQRAAKFKPGKTIANLARGAVLSGFGAAFGPALLANLPSGLSSALNASRLVSSAAPTVSSVGSGIARSVVMNAGGEALGRALQPDSQETYTPNPQIKAYAEGGQVKGPKPAARRAMERLPFGALKFVINDLPDGIASVPYAVMGLPKLASIGLNKAIGTPVLPYNAAKDSGMEAVDQWTDGLTQSARDYFGVPKPEFGSPEYMGELAGAFVIPSGGIAQALKGGAKLRSMRGALATALDFGAMPMSNKGKAATAGLMAGADYLSQVPKTANARPRSVVYK